MLTKPNPYDPKSGPLTFFGDGIVPEQTKIRIFTVVGEQVAELGDTSVQLDLLNGIYIYTYESPRERGVGKFTVVSR